MYTQHIFSLYMSEKNFSVHVQNIFLCTYPISLALYMYTLSTYSTCLFLFFFTTFLFSICTCEKIAGKWFKVLHQNTWSFLLVNQFWQQRHTQTVTKAAETWMDSILLLLNMAVCILFSSAKDCARADTSMLAVFLNKQIKESKVRKWKRGN